MQSKTPPGPKTHLAMITVIQTEPKNDRHMIARKRSMRLSKSLNKTCSSPTATNGVIVQELEHAGALKLAERVLALQRTNVQQVRAESENG